MLSLDAANSELSRRSLLAFGKRLEPVFTDPPHIKYLCGLLEALEAGSIRRLVVSMPPRFAKTTTCSQLFPSWAIGRDSRRSILLANHSAELATSFSRKAKGYIESPLWPFGKIALSEDSRATHRWNVVPGGGGLTSVGVGSGITGIGADFLIIDDAINDGLSETERLQAWEWYTQIAFPRCNAGARILIVSARLAVDDLVGRLMESDDSSEYKFVSLPAINAEGNELGLPVGEPLWPEKFGHDELRQRREAMGLGAYTAQYMQDPSISGGGHLFNISDFGLWEQLPRPTQRPFNPLSLMYDDPLENAYADDGLFVRITAIDCAGVENTSTGGSWNAICTIMADLRDGSVYVVDVERSRGVSFMELRNAVCIHLAKHAPGLVVIESNDATGGRLIGDLSRTTHWPIKPVRPRTSKLERALQVIGQVESHKVFLPAKLKPWSDAFTAELAAFGPGARYTDQVDALVWCLLATRQYAMARREDEHWDAQLRGFSLFG